MMDAEMQAEAVMSMARGPTLGSHFMAVTFDALLCGIVICQCIRCIPNYKNDSLLIRVVMAFGSIAAIATTFVTWGVYMDHFVYKFGSYASFAEFKFFGIYPILDVLTVVPVQLVFADRSVRINQRNIYIIALDHGLIALTFASAVSVTALSRGLTIFNKTDVLAIFLVLWPSVCTVTHLVLTGTILWGLFRSREGSRQTTQIIDRVIFMSPESQAPATLFAFTAMIVIASDVNSPFIPWVVIIHPKIFLIGCLAMINTRHTWQRDGKLPSTLNSSRLSSQPGLNGSNVSGYNSHHLATPHTGGLRSPTVGVSVFDDIDGAGLRMSEFPATPIEDKANFEAIGMPMPVHPKSEIPMV